MSHEALTWAWRQFRLKPGPRFVLVCLADRANHEGVCWPSYGDIAARTGYSVRQCIRLINHLIADDLVEVMNQRGTRGRQTSSLFLLHMERGHGMRSIGDQIHSAARATANMPRPNHQERGDYSDSVDITRSCGKAVDKDEKAGDKSVQKSDSRVTKCHAVDVSSNTSQDFDADTNKQRVVNKGMSQMSPLESSLEPKPENTHVVTTRSTDDEFNSYKERASMPADTHEAPETPGDGVHPDTATPASEEVSQGRQEAHTTPAKLSEDEVRQKLKEIRAMLGSNTPLWIE